MEKELESWKMEKGSQKLENGKRKSNVEEWKKEVKSWKMEKGSEKLDNRKRK